MTDRKRAGTLDGSMGGESFRIADVTSNGVSPRNGRRPDAIS
jgi:hypothetical protein